MNSSTNQNISNESKLIDSLIGLARSREDIKTFWKTYLRLFVNLCNGKEAMLLARIEGSWKMGECTDNSSDLWPEIAIREQLAESALEKQLATGHFNSQHLLAIRLDVGSQEAPPVLLVNLGQVGALPQRATLLCVAALPALFQTNRQYLQARTDVVFFAEVLQLVGSIAEDDKFKLATLRLSNEVATLFSCAQVSLGWKVSNHIRLQSISNMESFDDRTKSVWELEEAMEESVVQEAEILWPVVGKPNLLQKAHATYGGLRRVGHLLTLPIRKGEKIVGAITCEREEKTFSEQEIWRLRLLLELCTHWLERLENESLGFVEKIRRTTMKAGEKIVGSQQTGMKLIVLTVLVCLGFLFIGTWPYTIKGTFLLKADNAVFVASPIDGFIKNAPVRPGDIVFEGTLLVELDSEELHMEEASALAKLARYRREAEKAEAAHSLADMRIAELKAKETETEIERIVFRLKNTRITTPFNGVVAEGDLRAQIGAPVHKGEAFMTVASLEGFYLEVQIEEAELRHLDLEAATTITFVGKPQEQFTAQLEAITPQAKIANNVNSFAIRARPLTESEPWWRPGMSGVARIEAGRRTLWWKLTHQMFDYLRLQFWL